MKVLRHFVSTKRKQWRIFLLVLTLTTGVYFYWLFTKHSHPTHLRKHRNITALLSRVPYEEEREKASLATSKHTTALTDEQTSRENPTPKRGYFLLTKNKHNEKTLFLNVSYNVHIFYYPWYGNPKADGKYVHWNHKYLLHWNPGIAEKYRKGVHHPPDDVGSDFYPELGCYSSRDPKTIREHMRQIRLSGAGTIVVSWYPEGKADEQGIPVDQLLPMILNIANEFFLKVTLHIEPYKGRNEQTVRNDVEYIHKKYANHPAFYKYRTRNNRYMPLLYLYDSYHTPPKAWRELLQPNGMFTIRNTHYDCIMIALMVEFNHRDFVNVGGFDGFYTYFAVDGFTYGSKWKSWPQLKSFARQSKTIFIPSIGPGYIDTSIRPWNYANTRSRENGDYYKRSFQAALSVEPEIISITSFNEWHEGSQIEKAIPKSSKGFTYKDYLPNEPDYYLRLTRNFVRKFENWM